MQTSAETLLESSLFGATTEQWMLLAVAAVLSTIGLWLLRRFLSWKRRRREARHAETTAAENERLEGEADETAAPGEPPPSDEPPPHGVKAQSWYRQLGAELIDCTRMYFLFTLSLYICARIIGLNERGLTLVGTLLTVALIVQIGEWGNRLITFWMERYRAERLEQDAASVTTAQAVGFVGRLILWSVVGLLLLDNFGIDVTALIAGVGVAGIAIGLALQNVLGDLFASLSIVVDQPFVVGDFLIIDGYLGAVEHIGLKTTRIRSLGGEQIVFSNADLLSSRIRNYKRMQERRIVFTVGVTYQTPHEQVAAIPDMLRKAVEAESDVRFDRAHFKEYGDSSLVYEVVYYVLSPDYNVYMDRQQAINLTIHRRFQEEGIDFAYPTRTLHVRQATENGHSSSASRDAPQENLS